MPDDPPELAQTLRRRRDAIAARFASERPGSPLVDELPALLERIASDVERREASDDYAALRRCILRVAKEADVRPSADVLDALASAIETVVVEADLALLARAGGILSSSLDDASTFGRLMRLLVPRLADCAVIRLEREAALDVAVAHVDPAKEELVRELHRRFVPLGYGAMRRTRRPQLTPEVTSEVLEASAESPEHLALLERVGIRSRVIVPICAREHVFGALVLCYGDSGRTYTEQDVALATELASRAALAIDNARLHDASRRARARAEMAARSKDEFVAMLSHELRTPLNAIVGWVRLIQSGTLDESKRAKAMEIIERNAEAQNRLVVDLLEIGAAAAGRSRIEPSRVDMCAVVETVVEGLRPAASAKSIQIDLDLDRDGALLQGDAARLEQVVWRVLANAVKFTPRNGTITVRLHRAGSDVELVVADDGVGIEAGFLPHVFEIFRQSDASTSRVHGGLGIGLSIAKHVVELHGGSIEATSDGKDRGARFTMRLPVVPPVPAAAESPRARVAKDEPIDLVGIRALVVDDDSDGRELTAYILESCGADVRVAGSAAEALRELAASAPHVVLSGVGTHEEGYSLIRAIRTLASDEKTSTPAIALTVFARNEDRARALAEGFDVHMAKPVDPVELVRAVREVTRQRIGR